jgi:hypothetical protein
LIDVATSGDRNVIKKQVGEDSKNIKHLTKRKAAPCGM